MVRFDGFGEPSQLQGHGYSLSSKLKSLRYVEDLTLAGLNALSSTGAREISIHVPRSAR